MYSLLLCTQIPSVETTATGMPVSSVSAVLTAGPRGPMLMEDFVFLDKQSHVNRERIPERIVHAKGMGKQHSKIIFLGIENLDISVNLLYMDKNQIWKFYNPNIIIFIDKSVIVASHDSADESERWDIQFTL